MKLPNGTTIRSEYDFRELKYKNTPNLMEYKMTAQKSEVFDEFLKIAEKQDMLGLSKTKFAGAEPINFEEMDRQMKQLGFDTEVVNENERMYRQTIPLVVEKYLGHDKSLVEEIKSTYAGRKELDISPNKDGSVLAVRIWIAASKDGFSGTMDYGLNSDNLEWSPGYPRDLENNLDSYLFKEFVSWFTTFKNKVSPGTNIKAAMSEKSRDQEDENIPNLMESTMSAQKSEVFDEFLKIAEKQDMFGLSKTAMPEKSRYQEDEKTIKEKRVKSEEDIIEKAHPDPVFVAESEGEGGLVENQNEQHKKMVEVINKMPTGSLVSRYASAINELVKLANACDAAGETKAADAITRAAEELFLKLDTCCPLT